MNSERTRTIPFNKNPANAGISIQSNTLGMTTAANAASNTAAAGAGASAKAAASATTLGSFFASKAGIILISVVATVVVATAVVVPVVVTQSGDDTDETIIPVESIISSDEEIYVPHPDPDVDETTPTYTPGTRVLYNSSLISLTKNNFLESEIIGYKSRTVPRIGYEEVNEQISFGGDNSALDSKYDEILEENNKLIPSSTTFDEIDSDGKLYLNGNYIRRQLYKHVFSIGLYGGNVADSEKAVIKRIKLNPDSNTNYITGLYAPPGEVIKVEISSEDLAKIEGQLPFSIGFVTHNKIVSVNNKAIGIKRVPNLVSSLTITKTTGYIGSFLGGPIYIFNPPKQKQFTVTITGAVPYKHIIFGSTTKKQFNEMKDYSAPFFELDIRNSIRYSGALSNIKNYGYDNLMHNLIFWDKCYRTSRQVPSGSNKNLGIHFLFDPCVNSKGALALAYVGANWCQVPPSFAMALDFETATKYGVWGHIHELNHHFQRFGFNSVSNEVTNNVINIVEYILYTQLSGLRNSYSNAALTTISGNHNYMNPEHSLNLLVTNPPSAADEIRFYEPIIQAFGPYLFLKVTQYGQGRAGIDLFYESLVKTLKQNVTYYIEKVLNLVISESKKIELNAAQYPIFIPVSTIYQTGRYYTIDEQEYFSNTSFPYRIPRGGSTKLDFENHLIYPNGFTPTIESISDPAHGTLQKVSDLVYTYTPDATEKLSGRMDMTIRLINSNESIDTTVKLGLEFEVDNSKSVQTNYIFDSIIYTELGENIINTNIEGHSNVEFFPNFGNYMGGIKEGNIGVWEGKFRFDDDGYKYILYRGGRGPSRLYAKIGDETYYHQIGYITINQGAYMFDLPSYAYYYKEEGFAKGTEVKFKAYLLGRTLATGASAWMYIGISKEKDASKVKTLSASEIVGVDSDFDTRYEFYSGDPYYTEKEFDSLSFFDYSSVRISSPNYIPWDSSFSLDKLTDRSTTTYIHTSRGRAINERNPLTLIFDLGKVYSFDYIYFVKRGPNNYAPAKLTISTSSDGITYDVGKDYTTVVGSELVEINLDPKLTSRYVKIHITETTAPNPGYIALVSVEFIEKNIKYYLKYPEYANITYITGQDTDVEINYKNFPYFGHSYIVKKDSTIEFSIENTTGIRIKTCHKYAATIKALVDNDETPINSNDDFQIIVNGLSQGNHNFKFEILDGKFDLEYILYEK